MKIAYFDCIAGASGDMLLGALVDAGLPVENLREKLARLNLGDEFELKANRVSKNGFGATKVDVLVHEHQHGRHLAEIEAILHKSSLPGQIQKQAASIFRRLAEVEAGIHGQPVEQVHLHEVGGVDTIVDVVGTLVGLEELGVQQVYASALPLGRGFVQGAHGQIPLPAPATVALLKGVPVRGSEIEMELVTPTGAVLLTSLCAGFGPIPAMTLTGQGYGAGGRDLPIPNVLRLLLGEQVDAGQAAGIETLGLLETNVDDNSAEINGYVMEQLLAAGALDVFFTPIQMKKNRPATLLSVLCRPADVEALELILFRETSTLGVRRQPVERRCLERSSETVATPYGPVRVKVARLPDGSTKRAPEYEDCKQAAQARHIPLRVVYAAALGQAADSFGQEADTRG
jgi:pyridinium-3,5-bisthiocarboxylic acid mononucleotide nickel chelatase